MERIPPLSEILRMLNRHIVLIGVILLIGCLLSVMYALRQPKLYQTVALVQIEQPRIRDPLVSDTVGGAMLQRLQIIEQRLMARDNVMKIIEKHGLFSEFPGMSDNEKVFRLRTSTRIIQITDPALRWRQDVTPTALSIQVTDGDPVRAALIANEFLNNLFEQSRSRRSERVSDTLAFFEGEEKRIGDAIAEMDARIAEFKRINAASLPEGLGSQREQLVALGEAELNVESQIVEIRTSTGGDAGSRFASRIERLEEQLALFQQRRASVQALIDRGPQVERELKTLTRELEQLTDQFAVITRNRAEAEMGQMLETTSQAESFVVLETAQVPEQPFAPDRKKIVLMGVALSLVIAGGLIMLLELRKPVLRTAAQIERNLGLQPVIAIPNIEVSTERVRRRLFWVAGISIAVLGGLALIQFIIDLG